MIARIWRGWCPATKAEDYERIYAAEITEQLQHIRGCRSAHLLRDSDGDEVMFTSILFFDGRDDVRAFAGEDPGKAVVVDDARAVLTRWDERAAHHEVVADVR
jgi:heme-degrading monooxygenase HmoA